MLLCSTRRQQLRNCIPVCENLILNWKNFPLILDSVQTSCVFEERKIRFRAILGQFESYR